MKARICVKVVFEVLKKTQITTGYNYDDAACDQRIKFRQQFTGKQSITVVYPLTIIIIINRDRRKQFKQSSTRVDN